MWIMASDGTRTDNKEIDNDLSFVELGEDSANAKEELPEN